MTYIEAVQHNTQFDLKALWKDRMQGDGANLRWVKDPVGRIGFIKAVRPDAILIHYPVRIMKVNYMFKVQSWDSAEYKNMTRL